MRAADALADVGSWQFVTSQPFLAPPIDGSADSYQGSKVESWKDCSGIVLSFMAHIGSAALACRLTFRAVPNHRVQVEEST